MLRFFGSRDCVVCDEECAHELHHVDGDPDNNVEENWVPLCANHNKEEYYVRVSDNRPIPKAMEASALEARSLELTLRDALARAFGCNLVGAFLYRDRDPHWTVAFCANAINNLRPLFEVGRIIDLVRRLVVPIVTSATLRKSVGWAHYSLLCKEMGSVCLDFGDSKRFLQWCKLGNDCVARDQAAVSANQAAIYQCRLSLHAQIAESYRMHVQNVQGRPPDEAVDLLARISETSLKMQQHYFAAGVANCALHTARLLRETGRIEEASKVIDDLWDRLGSQHPLYGGDSVPEIIANKGATWWSFAGLLAEAASIALAQGRKKDAEDLAHHAYESYKRKRIPIPGALPVPALEWYQKEHVQYARAWSVHEPTWHATPNEYLLVARLVYKALARHVGE